MTRQPSSTARPDLRERRRLETQADISDAAVTLFEDRGVEQTTVEQIATAAGISLRTYFRYFPTKEAAALTSYLAFAESITGWLAEDLEPAPVLDSLEAAIQSTIEQVEANEHSRDRLLRIRRLINAEPLLQAAVATVDAAAAAQFAEQLLEKPGLTLTRTEARVLSQIAFTIVSLAIEDWAQDAERGRSVELARVYARTRRIARDLFISSSPDA
jgi:AcrR family transcriptional regulator